MAGSLSFQLEQEQLHAERAAAWCALANARDEQQHAALLQVMKPPSLGTTRGDAASTKSEGSGTMEINIQFIKKQGKLDYAFLLSNSLFSLTKN